MEKFADILNDLIEEKRLSLRKIASESHLVTNQLSHYLSDDLYPSIKSAIKLANYFDCSLDYLFGISDEKSSKYKTDKYDINKFYNRYQNALNENNITHWKFSKENKFAESLIRKWRKGATPSIKNLIIIAQGLSTSIDYLVGRE